ncbi:unnamed protein product, partial [Closterium sp. NIES-53]
CTNRALFPSLLPHLLPPPDPCYGVKCPDESKCAVQNGAVVCKCPAPFKRLINNRCSSDDYPNSDYLDPHNAARAAVGAVPLEWDDAGEGLES